MKRKDLIDMQLQNVDSSVIDKIKKLINTHNGCKKINSEAEAQTALNLAKRMMDKYHLSLSNIMDFDNCNFDDISIIQIEVERYSAVSLPIWIRNLLQIINVLCNNGSIIIRKNIQQKNILIISMVGERNDCDRGLKLYQFFKGIIMKLSREHQKKVHGGYTQWRSFAEGFTGRMMENMYRDIAEQEELAKESKIQTDNVTTDEFSLILQSNELEALKRYKKTVSEKISEFLKNQGCTKFEKLHSSGKVDYRSFKQGAIAANGYNVTKSSLNNKQLT